MNYSKTHTVFNGSVHYMCCVPILSSKNHGQRHILHEIWNDLFYYTVIWKDNRIIDLFCFTSLPPSPILLSLLIHSWLWLPTPPIIILYCLPPPPSPPPSPSPPPPPSPLSSFSYSSSFLIFLYCPPSAFIIPSIDPFILHSVLSSWIYCMNFYTIIQFDYDYRNACWRLCLIVLSRFSRPYEACFPQVFKNIQYQAS